MTVQLAYQIGLSCSESACKNQPHCQFHELSLAKSKALIATVIATTVIGSVKLTWFMYHDAVLQSSGKVLVLEDQFTSSPCPRTTKS